MTPGSEGKNEPNESFIFLAEKNIEKTTKSKTKIT